MNSRRFIRHLLKLPDTLSRLGWHVWPCPNFFCSARGGLRPIAEMPARGIDGGLLGCTPRQRLPYGDQNPSSPVSANAVNVNAVATSTACTAQ
jgi:hypothetical protein